MQNEVTANQKKYKLIEQPESQKTKHIDVFKTTKLETDIDKSYEIVTNAVDICRKLGLNKQLLSDFQRAIDRFKLLGQLTLNQNPSSNTSIKAEGRGFYIENLRISPGKKVILYLKGMGGTGYFSDEGHPQLPTFPKGDEFQDTFHDAAGSDNPRIKGMLDLKDAEMELIHNCVIFTNLAKKYNWTSLAQAVEARAPIPLYTARYPKLTNYYIEKIERMIQVAKQKLVDAGYVFDSNPKATIVEAKMHMSMKRPINNLSEAKNREAINWFKELYSLLSLKELGNFGSVLSIVPSSRRIYQYIVERDKPEFEEIIKSLLSINNAATTGISLRNMIETGLVPFEESLHGQNRYDCSESEIPSVLGFGDFADLMPISLNSINRERFFGLDVNRYKDEPNGPIYLLHRTLNAENFYIPEAIPNATLGITFEQTTNIQMAYWRSLLSGIISEKSLTTIASWMPLLRPEINLAAAYLLYKSTKGDQWIETIDGIQKVAKQLNITKPFPDCKTIDYVLNRGKKLYDVSKSKIHYIEALIRYIISGDEVYINSIPILKITKKIIENLNDLQDENEKAEIVRLLAYSFPAHYLNLLDESQKNRFEYYLFEERVKILKIIEELSKNGHWDKIKYITKTVLSCRIHEQLFDIPNSDGSNRAKNYFKLIQDTEIDLELVCLNSEVDACYHELDKPEFRENCASYLRDLRKAFENGVLNLESFDKSKFEIINLFFIITFLNDGESCFEPISSGREKLEDLLGMDKFKITQFKDFIKKYQEFKTTVNKQNLISSIELFFNQLRSSPFFDSEKGDVISYLVTINFLNQISSFTTFEDVETLAPLFDVVNIFLISNGYYEEQIELAHQRIKQN